MKKSSETITSDSPQDFESSLKELEELVEKLENGELSLKDSLACFERGVTLSRHCHKSLEQARQSVNVLTSPGDPDSEQPFPAGEPSIDHDLAEGEIDS